LGPEYLNSEASRWVLVSMGRTRGRVFPGRDENSDDELKDPSSFVTEIEKEAQSASFDAKHPQLPGAASVRRR